MASTTFVDRQTPIVASWLNDVNNAVYNAPANVVSYGADKTGLTDSTAAFTAALAASNVIYAPAGTYLVTNITLTTGKTLLTDGFATIFQQKSGQAVGTHIIDVTGSDVVVQSLKLIGNISTDTNEQQHGVFVRNTTTISRIFIGDLYGSNIRGDVLYIGGESGSPTTHVKFGTIIGSNILRNVVSIVGGQYIIGDAAITEGSTGYTTLDIEPNTETCHNIYVGYVKGAVFQCAPPLIANTAYNIHVGMLDLDPAYATNSTPTYSAYEPEIAIKLRNTTDIQLDHVKVSNHTELAIDYIWNSGEQRGKNIHIGYLNVNSVGSADTTYNAAIKGSAIDSITINSADVTLQSTSDCILLGDSSGSTYTRAIINRAVVNGTVARYISQGRFTNILINTTNAVAAFSRCYDCTLLDSHLTIPTLFSFSDRLVLINVTAVCSTAYYGSSVSDITRINCSFGGTVVPFSTTRASAAGQTGEVVYGGTTGTTVGASGAASALPANPLGYVICYVGSTQVKIPYYTA